MKRALLALSLIITIAAAAIAIYATTSVDDDSSDPAATVRKALDAYDSGDHTAVEDCFCDPALASVILPDEDTPRFSFSSVSIREDSRTDNSAAVILDATINGSALTWHLSLKRRSGSWCIATVN